MTTSSDEQPKRRRHQAGRCNCRAELDHLAQRMEQLENTLVSLRNELISPRNNATHADINAALIRTAHIGVGP